MTNLAYKEEPVNTKSHNEIFEALYAAKAREEEVPASENLIDIITDEQWCDKDIFDIDFSAGAPFEPSGQ